MSFLEDLQAFLEDLQALDMEGVAVTAAIDAAGNLLEVGGLWPKLKAARDELGRALHTVVVAKAQGEVDKELKKLFPDLHIIQAETVSDAVAKLVEHSQPRRNVRAYELESCRTLSFLGRSGDDITMETHYHELPLLRRVEELPEEPADSREKADKRDSRSRGDREEQPSERSRLRYQDILRWEEHVSGKPYRYLPKQHRINDLFADFKAAAGRPEEFARTDASPYKAIPKELQKAVTDVPKLVVLGPPGSGKSTLTRYLSYLAAARKLRLQGRELLPVRVQLRAWQAWAAEHKNYNLIAYLEALYHTNTAKVMPSADHWQQWLKRGDVLVLLDGLDELPRDNSFAAALQKLLQDYGKCPMVLTSRTVSFEEHESVCPNYPVFTLNALQESQRDSFIRDYPAQYPKNFDREALITQLHQTPEMQPLAASPLLLAMICFVTDDPEGVKLPAKRAELYDAAVNKLLQWDRSTAREETADDLHRKILERAALSLFVGSELERDLSFDKEALRRALENGAKEVVGADYKVWANDLLRELPRKSGIIQGGATQGSKKKYAFLHPTIHEFLAASALATIVHKPLKDGGGWDGMVSIEGREVTVRHLVHCKSWALEWEEVILLFASKLETPESLLRLLANEQRDDYFRHRLAVAALCLGEVKNETLAQMEDLTDHLTSTTYSLWQGHQRRGTEDAAPHLARALRALWWANGKVGGCPLREYLHHNLRENIEVIKIIGGIAATPEMVTQLGGLLRDEDDGVRAAAARAIGILGEKAATPEMVTPLGGWLHHGRDWVQPVTPEMVMQLGGLLRDDDPWVRATAIDAISIISILGEKAATLEMVTQLGGWLRDENWGVRAAAARAVGALGEKAATPEMVTQLGGLLRDEDDGVRAVAARAVGALGEKAATPEMVTQLGGLLRDEDDGVRAAAARAVGALGEKAATPEMVTQLGGLLRDEDDGVRAAAARAIGMMAAQGLRFILIAPWRWRLRKARWGVKTVRELSQL